MKLLLFLFQFLSQLATADIPVHCLRHQVQGEWEFTLGESSPVRSSCGHARPDDQNNEPALQFLDPGGSKSTLNVVLSAPDRAATDRDAMGTFTMIYDEGFEVAVEGKTFFAFSRFDLVPDQYGARHNVTHCDETLTGWYRDGDQFGCYYGKKKERTSASAGLLSSNVNVLPSYHFLNDNKSEQFDEPLTQEFHTDVVNKLNMLQEKTWTARVYRKFVNKTPRELNNMAGITRTVNLHTAHVNQHRYRKNEPFNFLQKKMTRMSQTSLMGIPDNHDWSEHEVLDPVVNQGDCGSCFSVATLRMLSARNRVKRGKDEEAFSIAFPLQCSEYNQGCDGGYAFLQSKWSEDVGLIPARCFPYHGGKGKCTDVDQDCVKSSAKYKSHGHRYVGGFYGGADEEDILMELYNNGPVVVSFEPSDEFMYYNNGIYKSSGNEIHQEWQKVDHAVLLVGYGEENGQKFWKIQNSWGNDWGESGFFRIARGDNDSAVESIAVAADVERSDNNVNMFLQSL